MRSLRGLRTLRRAAIVAAVVAWLSAGRAVAGPDEGVLPPLRDADDAVRAQLPPPDVDPFLGVVLDDHEGAARVARVVPGSSAEIAGVLAGDVLRRFDETPVTSSPELERAIRVHGVGARVRIAFERGGASAVCVATLGSRRRPDDFHRGSKFELAVVPLRFADDAGPSPDAARLTRLLFSKSRENGPGASVADYYRAQSFGRFALEGRVLEPVTLPLPRSKYAAHPMGGGIDSAFAAAAKLLEAREGAATRSIDGLAFLYVGAPETRSGFALWPHRANVTIGSRRVPYYVHAAGGADSDAIGVHCHEFGHLLGLPDAYGAAHLAGCGDFCVMAIGHRGGPKFGARSPLSLCAWCRMRLGWIDPVVVDPRTPQRLRLRPPTRSFGEALLVPLTPRTDEYLLVEVRRREGFDAELPSSGLFVWHVGGAAPPGKGRYGGYVELVAAHGVDCIDSAFVRTDEIAFPTARARDLTPDTRPGVRSTAPGAFDVYLTSIESRPDGSVAFTLGVPKAVTQSPPAAAPTSPLDGDGYVVRVDPVTGRSVKLYVGPLKDGELPTAVPLDGDGRR
jgi:M6 family metalloprotease-like protein